MGAKDEVNQSPEVRRKIFTTLNVAVKGTSRESVRVSIKVLKEMWPVLQAVVKYYSAKQQQLQKADTNFVTHGLWIQERRGT